MNREDARGLAPAAQYEKRKQVIRLYLRGKRQKQIAEDLGLSFGAVKKVIGLYKSDGVTALKLSQRGRRPGEKRVLDSKQEEAIQRVIKEKRPEQLRMRFALWTREAVHRLILSKFGIDMPIRSVGNYLKRWGFTPQKPIRRAYERCPQAVKEWLDEKYPVIVRRAKEEGAQILWADESGLNNTDVRGRGYAPKGQTPVALHPAKRETLSMISAVSNQGAMQWMIVETNFNADRFIEFLSALTKNAPSKIFLVLDNLRVHHSRLVKAWVADRADKIELFYLPAYSPELNPDERLNADLKQQLGSRIQASTKSKLKSLATWRLQQLAANPDRIKSYFQDPRCKYAA